MSRNFTLRALFAVAAAWAIPCAGADTATPASPATPAPVTPQQQALQQEIDHVQGQMASAMNAHSFADYQKALDQFVLPTCLFTSVSGNTVSYPKYLTYMQASLASRSASVTEQIKTKRWP